MLLLRIHVYPYECMDKWGDFNETSLPQKKYIYIFYSNLNMEDIRSLIINHSFIITLPHRDFS